MEFVPKAPREGINVSEEHPLKEASILTIGLGALFVLIFVVLVWFVEIAVRLVPRSAEARVFSAWQPDDLDTLVADDRADAVQDLIDRLLAHAPPSHYSFRVGVLPDDAPNALALPGGLILVTDGLLDLVETENELALVLGHELGHYEERDHLRGLGRGVMLGIVFSAVFRSQSGLTLSELVANVTLNGFGRTAESAADRFGLGLVHAEYGHTAHAADFFERLEANNLGSGRLTAYLSTHPSNTGRIADLAAYADENGWDDDGEGVPLSFPGDE